MIIILYFSLMHQSPVPINKDSRWDPQARPVLHCHLGVFALGGRKQPRSMGCRVLEGVFYRVSMGFRKGSLRAPSPQTSNP